MEMLRPNGTSSPRFPIWEGVFAHYRDVPATGKCFENDTFLADALTYTTAVMRSVNHPNPTVRPSLPEHEALLFLAAAVAPEGRPLRLIDFGGCLGTAYLYLRSYLNSSVGVEYLIVETPKMVAAGRDLFANDHNVRFFETLTDVATEVVDIVYVNSALQYIEDYAEVFCALCRIGAQHFLLARLSAGDFSSYASAQRNVQGNVLAYWFINANELIRLAHTEGYSLKARVAIGPEHDQSNFPPDRRMGRTCNLLFRKR